MSFLPNMRDAMYACGQIRQCNQTPQRTPNTGDSLQGRCKMTGGMAGVGRNGCKPRRGSSDNTWGIVDEVVSIAHNQSPIVYNPVLSPPGSGVEPIPPHPLLADVLSMALATQG